VTASIQDDVRRLADRPLEELYPSLYLDALQVSIRDQQVVRKKAVYIAVGSRWTANGTASGSGIEQDRGRSLLDERAHRAQKPGRERTSCFVCTDGLTGFPTRSTPCSRWPSTRPVWST